MVELVVDRCERGLDVGEVHHPAGVGTRLATDVDFHPERVAVQARTFVPGRNIRQPMRRFDVEDFEDIHAALYRRAHAAPAFDPLHQTPSPAPPPTGGGRSATKQGKDRDATDVD